MLLIIEKILFYSSLLDSSYMNFYKFKERTHEKATVITLNMKTAIIPKGFSSL